MTQTPATDGASSQALKQSNGNSGSSQRSGEPDSAGIHRTGQGWWWCLAIAAGFTVWALRTNGPYGIAETDAARHAMNGAFLHDLIARGKVSGILAFARSYFAHFPALSLPYHPPLFPMMEAVFFLIFGVNALVARMVVATAVAASAVVFFRLVMATHKSTLLAVVSTITFLTLPEALWVGGDVMLEYPALVSTLLAIYLLQRVATEYSMARAVAFAVCAGAAVWTKQQSVFLAGVPFLYLALIGRRRLLLKAPIWVSSVLFGTMVAALAALSLPFNGAGVNQATGYVANGRQITHLDIFLRNLIFYTQQYPAISGPAGVTLMVALVVWLAIRVFSRGAAEPRLGIGSSGSFQRGASRGATRGGTFVETWALDAAGLGSRESFQRGTALYGAWVLGSLAVLLLIRPLATRYLFFTLPALIVLGYTGLILVVERFTGKRQWAVAAAVVVLLAGVFWQFPYRTQYLHGPEEAARMLAGLKPNRILYCGGTDGYFIFSYRSLREGLDTTIISGDKLPPGIFTPSALETFAHDYGVQYIVLENVPGLVRERPWTALRNNLPPSMIAEREIQLVSSGRWNGMLHVYRFTNPSPVPKDYLSMRMRMIGGTMDFQLNQ